MIYLLSFLYCGFICSVSQFVLEKTKFTPGHMNTLLVIIGCILSGFGIYDEIVQKFHAGATVPIINFGHLLVTGAYEGFIEEGCIGLFKGVLVNASAGVSFTIFCAFIVTLIFKVRN